MAQPATSKRWLQLHGSGCCPIDPFKVVGGSIQHTNNWSLVGLSITSDPKKIPIKISSWPGWHFLGTWGFSKTNNFSQERMWKIKIAQNTPQPIIKFEHGNLQSWIFRFVDVWTSWKPLKHHDTEGFFKGVNVVLKKTPSVRTWISAAPLRSFPQCLQVGGCWAEGESCFGDSFFIWNSRCFNPTSFRENVLKIQHVFVFLGWVLQNHH